VAIDDHSRVGFSLLLVDEKATRACAFLIAAPRTNGKAARFIQTLLREWAYAFAYPNSDARASELAPWMYQYNFHRPHSATSHRPPASRLGFDGNSVVRNYTSRQRLRPVLPSSWKAFSNIGMLPRMSRKCAKKIFLRPPK